MMSPTLTMPPQSVDRPPSPAVMAGRGLDGLSIYGIDQGEATWLCTIHDVGPTADRHKERMQA